MSEHTFPITIHWEWKIFVLWVSSSSLFILPNNCLTIKRSPSKGGTSHSLSSSSLLDYSPVECSLMYSPFVNNIIVLRLGHLAAICPLPKYLKHFFELEHEESSLLAWEVTLPFEDSFSLDLGMVQVAPSFLYVSLSLHEVDDFLWALHLLSYCSTLVAWWIRSSKVS